SQPVPLPPSVIRRPGALARAAKALRLWHQRARSRNELSRLGWYDLHDMGISQGDAWQEYSKPFWRE
ncbi:MAG: DUF1127 domain-containing protein, partial [Acetobacteraceae bacterium]